ncbi:MAG: hypothetical protein LBP62_00620 [Clostridiales bacterium]|nr:hypothetical protein [Clostridiales bacterium]
MRELKKQQRSILIAGAFCASFGVVGGVALALIIKPIFLILLIGSAVIFFTALFFCRYIASSAKKSADVYLFITFDKNTVKIEKNDPSLLTPAAAVSYPLETCSVSAFPDGNYRLTAEDGKNYSFNADGFIAGSPNDLAELLKNQTQN